MRSQFKELFTRHGYNVRPGSFFNVGSGWEQQLRQASAALAGCDTKVWLIGASKDDDGSLLLDIDFEGKPSEQTANDVTKLIAVAKAASLKTCEVCGKLGSLRDDYAVRCAEHATLFTLEDAAKMTGMAQTTIWHIIDVGDIIPALTILHDGTVWHEQSEFGFTAADIITFQEERERRGFRHVHEQFGYVVPSTAKFSCGPGWETVIRRLAERLGRLPGPPKLVGGKEKFGSFQSRIVPHSPQRDDAIDELARETRKLSLTICEECGAPGRLRMGISIAKTTCDRHAHLAGELREDDGWILDLPPTGGPIYADGQQGRYGIDRDPEGERQKRNEAALGKSEIGDTGGDYGGNN